MSQDPTNKTTTNSITTSSVKRGVAFFENLVVVAIVLVLIHTLVEDIANMFSWSWTSRQILIYSGFLFDLFFSIEFLLRFFNSLFRGKVLHYLRDERGWVDFVASIPLLVFNSAPAALSVYLGVSNIATAAGTFGALKVVKAIRIARVLRLLRFLKIFRHIKHVDSAMAQRHLSRIATTSVTIVILSLVSFSLFSNLLAFPDLGDTFEEYTVEALNSRVDANLDIERIEELASLRPDILIFRRGGEILFSRYDNAYFSRYYGPSDYTYLTFENGNTEVFIDLRPILAHNAAADLLHFTIIILIILACLFIYGPHFASTISDPIQIMRRGLGEKGYSLQVLIQSRYKDDETFSLAQSYNENFLPIKDRHSGETEGGSIVEFDFEDVKKFLDRE